jgi:hypothetical protein
VHGHLSKEGVYEIILYVEQRRITIQPESNNDESSDLEVEIDASEPTVIASNGQVGAVVFNMDLIAARDPALAERIRQLYDKAQHIKPEDKLDGAEEDIALVHDMFKDLMNDQDRQIGY